MTDRIAAECAYIKVVFDYASAPIGSRDWVLFWQGWQAAGLTNEASRAAFGTWQVMPRNATVVRDPRLDWSDSGPVEGQ